MRATQSQSRPSQSQTQPSNAQQQQQQTQSQQYLPPPADSTHLSPPSDPPFPPQRADSPSYQLQAEAHAHPEQQYPHFTGNAFDMPLDPALIHSATHLANLPPSPFLSAQNTQHAALLGEDVANPFAAPDGRASIGIVANEYAHTGGPARRPLRARAEMRRRLDGVARYAWRGAVS